MPARERLLERGVLLVARLVLVRRVDEVEARLLHVGDLLRQPLPPEAAPALRVSVRHHDAAVEPLLAEAEDEACRAVALRAAPQDGRDGGIVEMRVVELPRNGVRPLAPELDRVRPGLERKRPAPGLDRLVAVLFAAELLRLRVAAGVLPHARHELDLAVRERRHLAAPDDPLFAPRRDCPDVLDERGRANAEQRGRIEEVAVPAVVVAPGVDDPRLAGSVAAVRDEDADLVRPAEVEERRELDRAVRVQRDAGLLPVHEDDRGAPVELLLEADAAALPVRGDVDRALEPARVGGLFVVAGPFALRDRRLLREAAALLPRLRRLVRRNRGGPVLDALRADRLHEPAVRDVQGFECPSGDREGKEKKADASHGAHHTRRRPVASTKTNTHNRSLCSEGGCFRYGNPGVSELGRSPGFGAWPERGSRASRRPARGGRTDRCGDGGRPGRTIPN